LKNKTKKRLLLRDVLMITYTHMHIHESLGGPAHLDTCTLAHLGTCTLAHLHTWARTLVRLDNPDIPEPRNRAESSRHEPRTCLWGRKGPRSCGGQDQGRVAPLTCAVERWFRENFAAFCRDGYCELRYYQSDNTGNGRLEVVWPLLGPRTREDRCEVRCGV
jgi:hypothetical protein